ncbi:MAG: nucleoside triphosphate pyrophosphohydrolase [Marinobacterium sp.]|nr:nucleoside triphosphate pyrophosphohydrolase [Marinobacterium sp.]
MSQRYTFDDLRYLMARLRDPQDGCPWDLKQHFATIVPHTLEEAYEVADCIEQQDFEHLESELGDLLFQVIFYARLGEEGSLFDLDSIVDTLTRKLIRRHPHVFPLGTLKSRAGDQNLAADEVKQTWEQIKQQERVAKAKSRVLDDVPRTLPALNRAAKLTKRAAQVGFDWPDLHGVLDKIEEELGELREAVDRNVQHEIADEMGDLLFALVNLSRHLKVNPDTALRSTNHKFERRFNHVEDQVEQAGGDWQQFELQQLDLFWDEAKAKGL